jgi:hypothetical protein
MNSGVPFERGGLASPESLMSFDKLIKRTAAKLISRAWMVL